MPLTESADALHAMKYREPGESFREAMNRIAFAAKDSDEHYHALRGALLAQRFLPGGRIQAAAGASKLVTLLNCYASGTIQDSFVDGPGNIMQRATEAAATLRLGGGIGYDFSTLRPRGSLIKKLMSASTGPVEFMGIFQSICKCVMAAGHRRGAQMGILRIDHPDIEEFIKAKQNNEALRQFNISIAVTNAFMVAVQNGEPFDLTFNGDTYKAVDAQTLWESVMRSTWDWAEPGVLFIDTINSTNNLWYCETIAATNPCSEQPLPPFGACLLGSLNLVKYLVPKTAAVGQPRYEFDTDLFQHDIAIAIRGLDNVLDKALFPLPEQRVEAVSKRRMGLGVTGVANCIEALGFPYGTPQFVQKLEDILHVFTNAAYTASALLAKEKGTFPYYDKERYLQGQFISTLDDDTYDLIQKHGVRNSHLTSIAPTGTISLCADNVSSGIEPVFSHETTREILTPDGVRTETLKDYGVQFLHTYGRTANEVSIEEHLNVLATAQKYIDSAISKTLNMDGTKMSWGEFKDIYTTAWERGCKGVATFNNTGKRMALLKAQEPDDAAVCTIDPNTGARECG